MESRIFLSLMISLSLSLSSSGCTAWQEPYSLSWWLLVVLGLVILLASFGGSLAYFRYDRRLRKMEADLGRRSGLVEQQRHELESLYRADDELRRHMHLDDVLQSLVDSAVELLHADKGALLVWDEQRETLYARATHGFMPETVAHMFIEKGEGLAGKVALNGELSMVEDTLLNGRGTPSIIKAENLRALMQVPIRVAGEVFGVFSADYLQPHHFSEQEQRLLIAFAQRAGLAIETARLYEREQQLAVMQERNRLARDLHDSVTQSLYGVTLFAEVASQLVRSGNLDKAAENIIELKGMALDALAEMRVLIYELRPSVFEQEGLAAALQARLDAVEGRVGLKTNLSIEGQIALPSHVEDGLYRITQEALNNVLKHANAHTVSVKLTQDEKLVCLEVADDGEGFDVQQACEAGCLGLRGMKERAEEMDAEFEVLSQMGNGTRIIVRRPVA